MAYTSFWIIFTYAIPKNVPKNRNISPKTIFLSQKRILGKTEEIKNLLLSRHFSTFEFFPKTSFPKNTM